MIARNALDPKRAKKYKYDMEIKKRWVCIFAVVCIFTACANAQITDEKQMNLDTVVLKGGVMGYELDPEPGLLWITDEDALETTLAKLSKGVLNGTQELPSVDFDREGVLLVWMGEKPTGGYNLALDPAKSLIQNQTAFVAVNWVEPPPGAVVTQVVTYPFLMVRMLGSGFDQIVVMDQHGRTRMRLDLSTNP